MLEVSSWYLEVHEASSEYLEVQVVKQSVSVGAGSKQWVSEARTMCLEVQEVSSVYLEVFEADLEV